jgi:peptidoglycan/xylan/chitin deacetylase (PgdA/CDA1 family)
MVQEQSSEPDRLRLCRERQRRVRHRWVAAAVVLFGALAVAAFVASDRRGGTYGAPPRLARASAPTRRPTHSLSAAERARRSADARRVAIPILMYHVIAPPFPTSPYPGLYVPPAEFAAQMRALAAAGFHAVTLDRARAAWRGEATLPAKPLVLTFDNGYRTQYTEALPVLRRLGWVADENIQLTGLPPKQGGLGKRQVRALVAAGWELDTQGYDHADLNTVDAQQLHFQVAVTRRTLQRMYHVPVDWFCYPSGHYDATVVAAVRAAGFVGSTTVVPGWARWSDNRYELPRLRVLGGTSPQSLLALIAVSEHDPPAPAAYPLGA